jgi:hypothetical protein
LREEQEGWIIETELLEKRTERLRSREAGIFGERNSKAGEERLNV